MSAKVNVSSGAIWFNRLISNTYPHLQCFCHIWCGKRVCVDVRIHTDFFFFFVKDKRKQTNKLLAALKKLLSNMCFAIRTLTFTSQKRPTSEGMAFHRSYFVFVSVCGCENVWSCVCVLRLELPLTIKHTLTNAVCSE